MEGNKSVVGILRSQVNTRRGKSILEILQPGGHWYFSETVLITLILEIYSKKIYWSTERYVAVEIVELWREIKVLWEF